MMDFGILVLILRLVLSPVLIACATLIGRRWGPATSGWFTGFPFVSAPISIVFALHNGFLFAVEAANGTIGGQCCVCIFALVYYFAAKKWKWYLCAFLGIAAFIVSAFIWKSFSPNLFISTIVLLVITFLGLRITAEKEAVLKPSSSPAWDLPVRMIFACLIVFGLTEIATAVGPKWSGIFSAFPVFGLILSTFTHAQQGSEAAQSLLRGSILGSFGIATFYLLIGLLLPVTQTLWIYFAAAFGVILINIVTLRGIHIWKKS